MSTMTNPTGTDSGGLAPDPVVTPTRSAGARKLPIMLGVMTAFLALILLRSPHSGETTFRLDADTIQAASQSITADPTADPEATARSLWDVCRGFARTSLDALADRIDARARWEDLVLPDEQQQTLREIVAHVRQRMTVYEGWGFAAQSSRGLGISATIAGLKAAAPGARIACFVSHVNADAIREAREAGADQVLARSAFTQQLPEILKSA
jgi:hypothetical protein